MGQETIKLNKAMFATCFVKSFASEKEFVEAAKNMAYFDLDEKSKTELLKTVYKIAKKEVKEPIEEEPKKK